MERLIDRIAPFEMNEFLGRIMRQLGESDPVKAVNMVNKGEVYLSNIKTGWDKNEDIVSFDVTSHNTSGEQWLKRLRNKGVIVSKDVEEVLLSERFRPTDGITTKVMIFRTKSPMFGSDIDPLPIAQSKGLIEPINGAEVACLIRDKFTNQQLALMGLLHLVIGAGDLYFYIHACEGQQPSLYAFEKRVDSSFAYTFQVP